MGLHREGIVSVAAVVVGDSVAVHHHPPIVLGAVSMTDNAVVGISRAGIELGAVRQTVGLLVGTVRHWTFVASGIHGDELLAVKQIDFCLLVRIVSRHAPAGVKSDGGYRYVPAHTQPAVAPATAIGQGEVGLHTGTALRNLKRITDVGGAVVVGRRRLDERYAVQWVHCLEVCQCGRHKSLRLGHLGRLEQLVDEVGEVGGGGDNLAVDGINLEAFQTHPGLRGAVVVGSVDIVGCIAFRQASGVVSHAYLGIGREVLATWQKPVASRRGRHVLHALGQGLQILLHQRGDGIDTRMPHGGVHGAQLEALGL